MLAQLAAPSRPAYYPSQPSSYYYASSAHAQASQRTMYPRPNPVTMNAYNTGQGLGYGSRPLAPLSPRQQHPGVSLSHDGTSMGMGPGPGYQQSQYSQQARQVRHGPPTLAGQHYPSQHQPPQPALLMQPSPPHQYQQQYGTQSAVTEGYYQQQQMQRATASSLMPAVPRPYYGHHSTGPYHQHSYAHLQGSSVGPASTHNGAHAAYHSQTHSMFPKKATDVPPRASSPYIVPSGPLPDSSSMLRSCANCGTRETPSWRRCGPEQTILCNACGLYYNEHKRHRQFRVNADGRTRAVRSPKFKLIEGDRCPECTVRGGGMGHAGSGSCGTCQYIRRQNCAPSDLSPASSSVSPSSGDSGTSSDSSAAAPTLSPVTLPITGDLGAVAGAVLRPAPSPGQ